MEFVILSKKRSPKSKTQAVAHTARQLRIIGGQWRSRKLDIIELPGLRPTSDRIRETVFNWLAPAIHGAHCLDLFSGTGALGLESLSRGAAQGYLIEKHPDAARQIKQHLQTLGAHNAVVVNADAFNLATIAHSHNIAPGSIDIAYIDPPFANDLWGEIFTLLEDSALLASDALIYVESPREQVLSPPINWVRIKEKHAGAVGYQLYERKHIIT